MSDREYLIEEEYDILKNFVKEEFLEKEFSDNGEHLDDDQIKCLINPLTDALIRYNEGIETCLKSREVIHDASNEYVTWVSANGIHAISFTRALKGALRQIIFALPKFLLVEEKGDIIATLVQIAISEYKNNKHILTPEETYVYGLCYDFNNKYFDKDMLARYYLKEIKVKKNISGVTYENIDKLLEDNLPELEKKGLLSQEGTFYRIMF